MLPNIKHNNATFMVGLSKPPTMIVMKLVDLPNKSKFKYCNLLDFLESCQCDDAHLQNVIEMLYRINNHFFRHRDQTPDHISIANHCYNT